MKKYFLFLLLVDVLLIGGCSSSKTASAVIPESVTDEDPLSIDTEYRDLDTLVVSAPAGDDSAPAVTFAGPPANPSHTRANDLLHTTLDLRFDWDKEEVLGKATLRLKPYFYPTDQLTLDAKGFDIHEIRLEKTNTPLQYTYDGQQMVIQLDRLYQRTEEYTLYIDYTAHPTAEGGSAAITSDKGLFFIKPDADTPDKPRQIWTQGETENNSRWFPTIDKPNERCTQEMFLTIEDNLKTLSNGRFIGSQKNPDGTRTDHWKMDQPHAPYLFMVAIGDYAVVRDSWGDIPVSYYVEPAYEADARAIFPYTVPMLQFFSDRLQFKYPWPKFDQVVVRDYVSGAMENTTAVIFVESMQQHRRDLIDESTNETIVAHEMFHHWFGDLVTCESWANLTLNEGFANYSEYLWLEHKHGADEADFHLLNEWRSYFSQASGEVHPLIFYNYDDKEAMFDAHSYSKGGAVLHMLRNLVGDDAFFASLNRYLTKHAYSSVEVHDLRLAFEEVTGQDLLWFFNQWYLNSGHPNLNITYAYQSEEKKATVTVEQQQPTDEMPAVFQLPVAVDIYLENAPQPIRHQIRVTEREQTFSFDVPSAPKLIIFDADHALLAETQDNHTEEELVYQFYHAPKFLDRYEAIEALQNSDLPAAAQLLRDALRDPFWYIRGSALASIEVEEGKPEEAVLAAVRQMARTDDHSAVRGLALSKLVDWADEATVDIAKRAIETDSAFNVISAGFEALIQLDKEAAVSLAQKLENESNSSIINSIGKLYAETNNAKYLPFFEKNLGLMEGYAALDFFSSYLNLAFASGPSDFQQAVSALRPIATNMSQSPWRRVAVMNALGMLRNDLNSQAEEATETEAKNRLKTQIEQIATIMKEIAATETNEQLKSIYDQMLDR